MDCTRYTLYFLIKVLSLCAGALPLPHMWRLVSGVVGEGLRARFEPLTISGGAGSLLGG